MLAELAEIDGESLAAGEGQQWGERQQWDEQSLARREVLVGELGELCRSNPQVAVESHALLLALLERTVRIEAQLRQERSGIVQLLQETETHLKQLGAFGNRVSVDATLVDRLV